LLGRNAVGKLGAEPITIELDVYTALVTRLVDKTLELTDTVLADGDCRRPDGILLSGGMTKLDAVQRALEKRCDAPLVLAAEDAVAAGALLQGKRIRPEEWEKSKGRAPAARPVPDSAPPAEQAPQQGWAARFAPFLEQAERDAKAGRTESAIAAVDTLFGDLARFTGELYRRQALRLVEEGKAQEGYDLLKRAYRRDHSNRLVAVDFARTCYRLALAAYEAKRASAAVAYAEKGSQAVESLPQGGAEYARLLAQLRHVKSHALWALAQYKEAQAAMSEAVRLDPEQETYRQTLEQIRTELSVKKTHRTKKPARLKGNMRNLPCPCGSGKKAKHCCGA